MFRLPSPAPQVARFCPSSNGPDDAVLVKKRYSAFFGTDLDTLLSTIQPDVLVIAGVNTHAYVRMTAIDAYQRDYDVIVQPSASPLAITGITTSRFATSME